MAKLAEGDPTRSIVDIDTFGYYVLGFRARMIANPPVREWYSSEGLKRVFNKQGHIYQDEIENPHNTVYLRDCPWDTLPESLQTMLRLQYPYAIEGRQVQMRIDPNVLLFQAEALPDERDQRYEPTSVPMHSLQLQFTDYSSSYAGRKGEWRITRLSVALKKRLSEAMESLDVDELQELKEQTIFNTFRQRSTLQQLHDIARFMEDATEYVVVRNNEAAGSLSTG